MTVILTLALTASDSESDSRCGSDSDSLTLPLPLPVAPTPMAAMIDSGDNSDVGCLDLGPMFISQVVAKSLNMKMKT